MNTNDQAAFPSEAEIRRSERAEAARRLYGEMRDLGLIRVPLESYGKPWAQAVANNPEAWAAARAWTPASGNLYLWGPNGVGKSALCRRVLWAALWSGWRVADISGPDFCDRLCSLDARRVFEHAAGVRVLLLDDIDKGHWTAHRLALLLEMIDIRSEHKRATLITTQLAPRQLNRAFVSARPDSPSTAIAILRRLQPVQAFEMKGQDLRALRQPGTWEPKP